MKARDAIIAKVLEREGGVKDVGDGKGITRWGQTPDWLVTFKLPIPQNIADAAANYAEWMRITRLDQLLVERADVLADIVIDYAVHSSHKKAIKALQKAVKVKVDGAIGPVTVEAVKIGSDRQRAAAAIIADRSRFQGWLIARDPQQYSRFAHGWANRQAEFIMALVA